MAAASLSPLAAALIVITRSSRRIVRVVRSKSEEAKIVGAEKKGDNHTGAPGPLSPCTFSLIIRRVAEARKTGEKLYYASHGTMRTTPSHIA